METPTGYLHPEYAESLREFGEPRALPACGGWVLERPIPGSTAVDASGCYPFFACRDWSRLPEDLDQAGRTWVTLSFVADPFGAFDPAELRRGLDLVVPFKERYVVDLSRPASEIGSEHHRRYAERALRKVRVDVCPDPAAHLQEWVELYAHLIRKHEIRGIRAFSPRAFERQLRIPGLVMFRAVCEGQTAGLDLWYVQGDVAYGHLVACSPLGYAARASYALKWTLIRYFAGKARWIDLGGGAGAAGSGDDGLSQFKKGWATGTRTTWFCGRIFDRDRYAALAGTRELPAGGYFPAYRKGEFG